MIVSDDVIMYAVVAFCFLSGQEKMRQLNSEKIAPCHHEKMPNKQRKDGICIKLNRCAPSAPKFRI